MREVHLVGSDDGHLLLAPTPGAPAEFRLPVDERLTTLVRAGRRPAEAAPGLSPRQIQAELRAGASLDDVAARAGVPVDRLELYAAPVLAELARVLDDALAARMSRPQHGPSTLPLGSAVFARLAVVDVAGTQPQWSARRDDDATWVVEMRYAAPGGATVARWRWDRAARSLTPLDSAAADLGHVGAGTPAPELAPAPVSEAEVPAGDEAAADPAPPTDPSPEPARPARPTRGGRRAAVPAWADVILGVSPGTPTTAPRPQDAEAAG